MKNILKKQILTLITLITLTGTVNAFNETTSYSTNTLPQTVKRDDIELWNQIMQETMAKVKSSKDSNEKNIIYDTKPRDQSSFYKYSINTIHTVIKEKNPSLLAYLQDTLIEIEINIQKYTPSHENNIQITIHLIATIKFLVKLEPSLKNQLGCLTADLEGNLRHTQKIIDQLNQKQ